MPVAFSLATANQFTPEENDMSFKAVKTILMTAVLALVSMLFLSGSVSAQVNATGSLSGTVKDKTGAVVSGATVTATNKSTGLTRSATTGDDGNYKIDLLPAGRYDVKVSAGNFADSTSENVELLLGRNDLNFTLNPAGVTGTVTVTSGETELVSKDKTDISINVTPRD